MMNGRSSIRVCYLIGDPVAQSLSPMMHNASFAAEGLNIEYLAVRVTREELGQAIKDLRAMNVLGLNVTIPHKSGVMKFIDDVDHVAKEIGAVNTIVNKEGDLKGYNTDWLGALYALERAGFEPKNGEKAILVGAGDAARAVAYALAKSGMELIVTNRHIERARDLSDRFKNLTRTRAVSHQELDSYVENVSLVVNCTPLGMVGAPQGLPLDPRLISGDMAVLDLVYNPMETIFVKVSRGKGARVAYGYDMLVGQGARAFELWTGHKAPMDIMTRVVLEHLKEAGQQ